MSNTCLGFEPATRERKSPHTTVHRWMMWIRKRERQTRYDFIYGFSIGAHTGDERKPQQPARGRR
jgi:hypothetical protein